MSESYFLRWKAQVSGPFDKAEISGMLKSGRISKHHQISQDKSDWVPMWESETFRSCCRNLPVVDAGQGSDAAAGKATLRVSSVDGALHLKGTSGNSDQVKWYYVDGDSSAGPVSVAELRSLVASGIINQKSPICREGDEKWVKAASEFPDMWAKVENTTWSPKGFVDDFVSRAKHHHKTKQPRKNPIDNILSELQSPSGNE